MFLELLDDVGGPVRITGLETVGGKIAQGLADMRAGFVEKYFSEMIPLLIHRRAAEPVHFQSIALRHGQVDPRPGDAVARANNRPSALGTIPVQAAIRPEF